MHSIRTRAAFAALAIAFASCATPPADRLDDEAMRAAREAGLTAEQAAARFVPSYIGNYFKGMDGVIELPTGTAYQLLDRQLAPGTVPALNDPVSTAQEVFGRNTWMIWAAGNEGFWDWLGRRFGFIDLLKLVDSKDRASRFATAGLINEPGMEAGGVDEFGLRLDQPSDPIVREWRRNYLRKVFGTDAPAGGGGYGGGSYSAAAGYRGPGPLGGYEAELPSGYEDVIPPPEIYGLSSGVVGLRLFPNPKFDAEAWAKAKAKYYDDPVGDPKLERPFRVGMSCAFCHASYHPLNPPRDKINPRWENISGSIGAQYLRPRAVFANLLPKDNFIYHILDSQPPGTIDTSLIASDNINNPNTMNAVFNLRERAVVSLLNPRERQAPPSAHTPSLWQHPRETRPQPDPADMLVARDAVPEDLAHALAGAVDESGASWNLVDEVHNSNAADRRVPRILVDGADSIGAWGALARVYLNIGTNYEQWNTLHEPVVGFLPQRPFTVAGAKTHSVYWNATQYRVGPLRDYFLKVARSLPLLAAHDAGTAAAGAGTVAVGARPSVDASLLAQGRRVFARNCVVCHSSIQPRARVAALNAAPSGELWDHNPGQWLSDPAYLAWAEAAVENPEFWRNNYLSTDFRVPVNVVGTNACRAMATNAVTGHMWEDFASESYRTMPSVGAIPFFNPYRGAAGAMDTFTPRHKAPGAPAGGGGPGFYRVPTLVGLWATAPYLHNNSLGLFNNDPSIAGRLAAFEDGMEKLLWPEKRLSGSSYNEATPERLQADRGLIWRTPLDTYLSVPGIYVPEILGMRLTFLRTIAARYPRVTMLTWWQRPLPALALLALALAILLYASRKAFRYLGYAVILAALLVGGLVYLLNGAIGVHIGPIPKGVPVGLLANTNPEAKLGDLARLVSATSEVLTELASEQLEPAERDRRFRERVAPALMAASKCPDFVMDRGHYFEWFKSMTDQDKRALIELLKTF